MDTEHLRQFLIELVNVPLDHVQFIEGQCLEASVYRMQIGAGAERVAQLVRCGVEPLIAEAGDGGRVCFTTRDGAQHAAGAGFSSRFAS